MARLVINQSALQAFYDGPCHQDLKRRADNVLAMQQRIVAVDTGRLLRSLRIDENGDGFRIGTDLYYAIYVELGTRRMWAQPYIRPSVDAARF